MSNHSIIEHRANYHYFKLEEDYVEICRFGEQYPQCKAAILAVLEHWINDKRTKGQDEHVYMTYPEWIDAMYGLFRRSHIIACLNELVEEGFIARRPCKRHGKDTFEYAINIKLIQARLKGLPERTEKYCRPNLNASKFKRVQKQTGANLNASTHPNLNASEHGDPSKFGRNIDSLPEILSSTIASEREDAFAVAQSSPAEMPSEADYHFYGTEQQHLRWNCRNWCDANHGTCEDYVAAIDAGLHERTTDKMPAVPPDVTPVSHSQSSIPDGYMQGEDDATRPDIRSHGASRHGDAPDTDTRRHRQDDLRDTGLLPSQAVAPIEQTVSGLSPGAVPAHHSGRAPDGAASAASPRGGPRASGDHVPDTEKMLDKPQKGKRNGKAPHAPVPIPVEAQAILDDWDSLFKAPIPRTEKHVQAAVDLVPCHPSKDDLKSCKDWLFTTDNPVKPWFKKIGVKLRDVADNFGAWQSVQPETPAEEELEPYSIPWFLAQQARRKNQELQA